MTPMSRPWADANLFPCTIFPTITEAGPTSGTESVARKPHYRKDAVVAGQYP